ncbi:M20/M25/M40 family metallo-hydrolase [Sphingomonas sp. LB-2]|uniref:M20/M25/M40 family metallo-hydrolase n=1 Tax=Sphingomonas caeni TaxID=2984949 RepID=UPI00222FBF01|nr:M20/M25/M40 family metallo-hydrolase [Sphingomonas caeni]MCW3846262.1 M20/M25/M40 family metallo-hydrolase [Sphingomonas caeni]
MRISLFFAALSFALAPLAAHAQVAPDEPVFSPLAVKAHVDFLASNELEGRNAGTRGHEVAARYVATRFESMGLKPGGPDGSWYQMVPLADYALDPAKPATLSVGGRNFANGTDVLIAPSPRNGNTTQTVSAPAVFAGYGLESDYAGLDVKGKLVVVLFGVPKGLSTEAARAAAQTEKGPIAGRHGAAGLIYVLTPQDEKRVSWNSARGYFLGAQSTWLGPNGFPQGVDPGVAIGAYANAGTARAMFEGAAMSADQVFEAAAAADGKVTGFPLKQPISLSRTSKVTIVNSPNVIGILPGSDPRLKSEYVVLSAHLDHEGIDSTLPGEDKIYNGAMDNAAGVATMLEAARAFAESRKPPKRSILFVALTAEEDGLIGSQYLAKYPVVGPGGKVIADVNLDMPILLYDFKDVVAFGAEHSTLGPIVERAAARIGVTLSPDPMPEEQLFVRSDHYSFVKAGVPSVFLVTGFANGGEKAFRDFLAHNYHKVSDQTDLPFDWAAGAKFAQINYLIAREIADGPEAPRWYEGNSFGDRFAPGQPRAPRPAAKP